MNYYQNYMSMNNKVYIIPFDWNNFKGNHTAMGSYLADKLAADFPCIKVIKMHEYTNFYAKFFNLFKVVFLAFYLGAKLNKGDKVFLMEYMGRSSFHVELARVLRIIRPNTIIYGMVHLPGQFMIELNKSKENIAKRMSYIDKCIVLGSSLERFLKEEIGYQNVVTIFHYVDTDYYKPLKKNEHKGALRVLSIGATKRDFPFMRKIIDSLPNVRFQICQGHKDLSQYFDGCKNVELLGFMPEEELLYKMQSSDINLSVMEDTIGSNVITTSLAVGMILVVSDVGSIRDYCSESESFLCKTQIDFIKAIEYLANNVELIPEIRNRAIKKGESFSYYEFKKVFKKYIIE